MHFIGITLLFLATFTNGQRITTIQLDGVQYFISRMNPYSPELNYFLSYQYCRSLGLQLASFETREKADSITQYLSNAGYNKYDFWISGNKLGTDMFLWMSTGLPFNATFNYMKKPANEISSSGSVFDLPSGSTSPQRTARESGNGGLTNSCVAMKAPTFEWDTDDCTAVKDFICEQTRCYYYNYGSIPVSSAQGKVMLSTTTVRPYTSSSTTVSDPKYVPMGINELINKLRSGSNINTSPSTQPSPVYDDVDSNTAVPYENEESDVELSTNGPYDNFHPNAELQDDPAAIIDHHAHEEDYVSTLEPEAVTHLPRSLKPSDS